MQNLTPAPEVIQNPVFPGLLSQDGMELFGLPDKQSYEWARQSEHKKIEYQGYKTLSHGMLKDNEIINKIAKKYDCSWADVCLKHALQRDISPVFSSKNIDHMERSRNNRRRNMFRSYTPVVKYTSKNEHIRIYGIFKWKKCVANISEMGKYEICI